MSVQPVVIDMAVAGRDSRASIRVVNDGARPLPVEFEILRIDLDTKGERFEKPAGDEFVVHPPQALIPPGATQIFRVQWTGNPDIKKSESYIFSVNQIPVKLQKAASGMQVIFNFSVVVNVAPAGGEASLRHIKSEIGKDEKGQRHPAVVVENTGNMHAYLSEASLVIESGQWKKSLTASEIKQMIGLGLVQPGKQRRFIIPVDLPPDAARISTKLEYKPKKAK